MLKLVLKIKEEVTEGLWWERKSQSNFQKYSVEYFISLAEVFLPSGSSEFSGFESRWAQNIHLRNWGHCKGWLGGKAGSKSNTFSFELRKGLSLSSGKDSPSEKQLHELAPHRAHFYPRAKGHLNIYSNIHLKLTSIKRDLACLANSNFFIPKQFCLCLNTSFSG